MEKELKLKQEVCGLMPGDSLGFVAMPSLKTDEYPHDYVQFDMGGRYLLIPFPLLEIWYQTAVKARRHIKGLDPEPTK